MRAHHSEPTDSELLGWLVHTLDSILGQGPVVMVVLIGVVVLLIPLAIAVLALRRRGGPQT
ncbi:MAG: hypothetical protein OXL97_05750 [Chloroflexota bacterium]|nr:hypothetical protein [Chloroflexota bacterium]MDE2885365.1 hypothetical protein [Chloroflexota bacterium]